ncbi:MAG: esterase-like activity of phytase family protein [Sphingorhabdus sp.]
MKVGRLALLLLLWVAAAGGHRSYWHNYSQSISVTALPLDTERPSRKKVGSLTFMGAWQLRSANSAFGAISGMTAIGNNRFLAVGDAGTLIGFTFNNGTKLTNVFIADLPGATGENINYRDRDSEGIAYDPASGRVWISYEVRHMIRRLPAALNRIDGVKRLTFTDGWKSNGGVETITRLADGRFLIMAETHERANGGNSAYLFSGDPVEPGSQSMPFGYRAPDGYRPTDAALLPDGRLLILNRRIGLIKGFTAKLTLLDPKTIERDKTVTPKLLATLAPPLLVDNMEGLTVTQDNGQTIVWMMSDNNFNSIQRTLLMKFALDLPNKKPEADSAPGFETL